MGLVIPPPSLRAYLFYDSVIENPSCTARIPGWKRHQSRVKACHVCPRYLSFASVPGHAFHIPRRGGASLKASRREDFCHPAKIPHVRSMSCPTGGQKFPHKNYKPPHPPLRTHHKGHFRPPKEKKKKKNPKVTTCSPWPWYPSLSWGQSQRRPNKPAQTPSPSRS